MAVNISLNAVANGNSPLFDSKYMAGDRPALRTFNHGDAFTIAGNYGTMNSVRTFLGGATGPWETTAIGATPANITNWAFDYTAGGAVVVKKDPTRGKVLYGNNTLGLNAAIRYQIPGVISENRRVFTTHLVKSNVRRDGVKYTFNHQTKHFRFNPTNSVSDNNPDLKWHSWEDGLSYIISTANTVGVADTRSFAPKNDNEWYRMELFINAGTQGGTNGRLIARVHHNGVTSIVHLLNAYACYGDVARHTSYVEQYYYGNFNGHVKNGEFSVGTVANNYTYRITATGWTAEYISSSNANETEILIGMRDAVINHPSGTRVAHIVGNKVVVTPIDPNDLVFAAFYSNGGSTNSTVGNPYFEEPTATTIEQCRDDQCVQAGSSSTDGWERVELRSVVDEATSAIREQQILSTWTSSGIGGTINVGGLPKGRHELYLCAISDIDATGKDVIVYSELVAIMVN